MFHQGKNIVSADVRGVPRTCSHIDVHYGNLDGHTTEAHLPKKVRSDQNPTNRKLNLSTANIQFIVMKMSTTSFVELVFEEGFHRGRVSFPLNSYANSASTKLLSVHMQRHLRISRILLSSASSTKYDQKFSKINVIVSNSSCMFLEGIGIARRNARKIPRYAR